jgi:7-cyano-7-deazaguanine tRNA-ribosyltransferase
VPGPRPHRAQPLGNDPEAMGNPTNVAASQGTRAGGPVTGGTGVSASEFRTRSGISCRLPLFLPVYQPRSEAFRLSTEDPRLTIDGLIINAFFLYKQRDIRKRLLGGLSLKEFVGFDRLIVTDSGAFQGFSRRLYLANKDIVSFQDKIGSDVVSPLDLVTAPGDKRGVAEEKMLATNKRIAEGQRLVERGILAGVQQGGRFLDLRRRSTEALMSMGLEYIAIGSLVPFFNKNHDMAFAGRVIREARAAIGPDRPMHVYGAGDPVELPFFFFLGATIFDSASYAHYANGGHYMTPYGALSDPGPLASGEFVCACPACTEVADPSALFADPIRLTRHNLWTIHDVTDRLRHLRPDPAGLERYLEHVLEVHRAWFPTSRLPSSWETLFE